MRTRTTTSPRFGELDGVADQIEQHLPQPAGIAHQKIGHFRRNMASQLDFLGIGAQTEAAQGIG